MQTENKKEQYLEPVGFKGSYGKWKVSKDECDIETVDGRGVCSMYATSLPDWNAILISQSKELAKALQDMIEVAEEIKSERDKLYQTLLAVYKDIDLDNYGSSELNVMVSNSLATPETFRWALGKIPNAKQVLKEAGLTNE